MFAKNFFLHIRENSKYIDSRLSPAKNWEKMIYRFYSYIVVIYFVFQYYGIEMPSTLMHYFIYGTFLHSVVLFSQAIRQAKEIWYLRNSLPHLGPYEGAATVFLKNGWPVVKGTMAFFGGTATANYVYGEIFGFTPLTECQYSMRGYQTWDQARYHLFHPREYDPRSDLLPWQQDLLKRIEMLEKTKK